MSGEGLRALLVQKQGEDLYMEGFLEDIFMMQRCMGNSVVTTGGEE